MLIKMFHLCFNRKKATNEANWPEVYRNGRHSLESLDLEDNMKHHSLGITTGLVCMLSGTIYY